MFEDRKPRLSPEDRAFLSVLDQIAPDAACIQACFREIDSGASVVHHSQSVGLGGLDQLEYRAQGIGHSVQRLVDAADPTTRLRIVNVFGETYTFQIYYAVPPDRGLYVLQSPRDFMIVNAAVPSNRPD